MWEYKTTPRWGYPVGDQNTKKDDKCCSNYQPPTNVMQKIGTLKMQVVSSAGSLPGTINNHPRVLPNDYETDAFFLY